MEAPLGAVGVDRVYCPLSVHGKKKAGTPQSQARPLGQEVPRIGVGYLASSPALSPSVGSLLALKLSACPGNLSRLFLS